MSFTTCPPFYCLPIALCQHANHGSHPHLNLLSNLLFEKHVLNLYLLRLQSPVHSKARFCSGTAVVLNMLLLDVKFAKTQQLVLFQKRHSVMSR